MKSNLDKRRAVEGMAKVKLFSILSHWIQTLNLNRTTTDSTERFLQQNTIISINFLRFAAESDNEIDFHIALLDARLTAQMGMLCCLLLCDKNYVLRYFRHLGPMEGFTLS